MDSLSQAALGAAVTEAVLGRRIGRRAVLLGAVLGTLPDLDVLVRHADAIDAFTLHRSWSHSLFVLSLGSLPLAALVRWPFGRGLAGVGPVGGGPVGSGPVDSGPGGGVPFGAWWFATWAALVTHPLLDAFTTYGTQLFWPMSAPPVAIASIFIIDPPYTVPLLIGLAVALRRRDAVGRVANRVGLGVATAWLVATLGLQQLARGEALEALQRSGVGTPDALLVLPFPFGVMWRAIALEGDDYAVVWVSLVDGEAGGDVERRTRGLDAIGAIDDAAPVSRLRWFTHGFVGARRIDEALVLTDLRTGTSGMPVFAFQVAAAGAQGWRRTLAVERPPAIDVKLLGILARRAVDADVPLTDGRLAGERPVPRTP